MEPVWEGILPSSQWLQVKKVQTMLGNSKSALGFWTEPKEGHSQCKGPAPGLSLPWGGNESSAPRAA